MSNLIPPMLATLVTEPFNRTGWINEEKYDGVRIIAYRSSKKVRLYSRNLNDLTGSFTQIAVALERLPRGDFVLDGEVVALDADGVSRFQLLQRRDRESAMKPTFAVFDCLRLNGDMILNSPLNERRKALKALLPTCHGSLLLARRLSTDGIAAFKMAQARGWEGIVAKEDSSVYEPGKRSRSWLKIKCRKESEFVIGGYTAPEGHRHRFGALLVGLYDKRQLRFTGKVGTGYSDAVLANVGRKMESLRTRNSPFEPAPRERGVTWIRPRLVAEVAFTEWTEDGKLRQPVFLGLRDDKNPDECRWEERDR